MPGPWFQSLRPGLRNGTSPSFLAEARIAELASLRSWYQHGAGPGPRARSQCHSSTPMTPTFCVGVTSQTTCLQPHGSTLHRNRAPPQSGTIITTHTHTLPIRPCPHTNTEHVYSARTPTQPVRAHAHTHTPPAHAHTCPPSMCAHTLTQLARTHTHMQIHTHIRAHPHA